jgi:ABC-2 type transport system ATP-binding protein
MGELEDTADHLVVVGRGRLLVDTTVSGLLAAASGGRVDVRTSRRTEAMTVLANAGATVAVTGSDALTVTDLPAEAISAALTAARVPFSQLSPHRATLEEAYMELTRGSVEFGTAEVSA